MMFLSAKKPRSKQLPFGFHFVAVFSLAFQKILADLIQQLIF